MRIVLVGGGGHASDVLGAFEAGAGGGMDAVIGFVDDDPEAGFRLTQRGLRHLGPIDGALDAGATHYVLATGWPRGRRDLAGRLPGLEPAGPVVDPRAIVNTGVEIGAGTVILGGACIAPLTILGQHVYVSHGALLGHDSRIGDFASVMPGAAIGGGACLEEGSAVGSTASVLPNVTVGAWATVGAGAVATRDVVAGTTVVGAPAAPR